MPTPPNSDDSAAAIMITLDGVSSFLPGFLGNTTVETPALDTLAAQGVSFDFAHASSFDLQTVLAEMFCGSPKPSQPHYVTDNVEGGSVFVSDCPIAIDAAQTARFDSIIEVPPSERTVAATSIAETQAADFFATAIEAASSLQQGDLLWLHFSGLTAGWDAPLELRQSFQGLDDPQPYSDVKPPQFLFDPNRDDPDELIAVQQACFAQVALIDSLLEIFLENLSQLNLGDSALVILAGTRGYPLGEHGYVGIGKTLHAQSLHVPLLVKLPDADESMQNRRSHRLIQTSVIGDWLADPLQVSSYCDIMRPDDAVPIFSTANNGQTAVETSEWKLLQNVDKGGIQSHCLFAKPDDRWEVNDVAKRCPGIVDDLAKLLAEHEAGKIGG